MTCWVFGQEHTETRSKREKVKLMHRDLGMLSVSMATANGCTGDAALFCSCDIIFDVTTVKFK